jgi:hypothetical protein
MMMTRRYDDENVGAKAYVNDEEGDDEQIEDGYEEEKDDD